LLLLHLSQIEETWEIFLSRNSFSQLDDTVNSPLNVNPNYDNTMTKSQGFDLPNEFEINEPYFVALQTPLVKKPRCIFLPRKSLEQVVDVWK